MVGCCKLNENTGPLHAAVPSITNIFSIEQAAQPWMAAMDIRYVFRSPITTWGSREIHFYPVQNTVCFYPITPRV